MEEGKDEMEAQVQKQWQATLKKNEELKTKMRGNMSINEAWLKERRKNLMAERDKIELEYEKKKSILQQLNGALRECEHLLVVLEKESESPKEMKVDSE